MKNLRRLFVVAATMMRGTLGAVDLEQYITGNKVDADGKTFLHILAENCDNNEFTIEIKPFNGIDKKIQQESAKLAWEVALASTFSEQKQNEIALGRAKTIVMAKDNDGETALDILKRKNAVANSCERCKVAMELFQVVHNFIAELEK